MYIFLYDRSNNQLFSFWRWVHSRHFHISDKQYFKNLNFRRGISIVKIRNNILLEMASLASLLIILTLFYTQIQMTHSIALQCVLLYHNLNHFYLVTICMKCFFRSWLRALWATIHGIGYKTLQIPRRISVGFCHCF